MQKADISSFAKASILRPDEIGTAEDRSEDRKNLISKILKNVKLKERSDLTPDPSANGRTSSPKRRGEEKDRTISIGFELAKILSKLNRIEAYPYKLEYNILFVRCSNSIVMMELILNEPLIIEELNKHLKSNDKIKHIKFFLDNKMRRC